MGKGIIRENKGGGLYYLEIVYDRQRIERELPILQKKYDDLEDKLYSGSRAQDETIRLEMAVIQKYIDYLNTHAPENQFIETYCADYTDDLEVGTEVGTIEFGRSLRSIIDNGGGSYSQYYGCVIQPGWKGNAAYSKERDGILSTVLGMSPAAFFVNLALNPAYMKWKPRYRYGSVTKLNGDYANVSLTDFIYFSSHERTPIDIDQSLELSNVKIEYMDCDGDAFREGDEVVVEFTGQKWSTPKVIGFTGLPPECDAERYYSIIFEKSKTASGWVPESGADLFVKAYFKTNANGDIIWISESEASAKCNLADTWNMTTNYPFGFIYQFTYDPSYAKGPSHIETWSYMPMKLECPDKDYAPFASWLPNTWGRFTAIYSDGRNTAVPRSAGVYLVGSQHVEIYMSNLGIGVITKEDEAYCPLNGVNRIETETWQEQIDGYLIARFLFGTTAVGEASYSQAGSGGGSTTCVDNFPDFLISSYNPSLGRSVVLVGISGPEYGFFGGGSQYYFTASFRAYHESLDTYACNRVGGVWPVLVPTDIVWPFGQRNPPSQHPATWTDDIAGWFHVLDDDGMFESMVKDNYKSFGHGSYGVDDDYVHNTSEGEPIDFPVWKWTGGTEYRCPCDEFIGYPDGRSNPTWRSGTLNTNTYYSSGTLKCGGGLWGVFEPNAMPWECWNQWTPLLDDDEEEPTPLEWEGFQTSLNHYSAGQEVIQASTVYYEFKQTKAPQIDRIFYRYQDTDIRLVVNFSQQSAGDGEGFGQCSFVVIFDSNGNIITSGDYGYHMTFLEDKDVDITSGGASVFSRFYSRSKASSEFLSKKSSLDCVSTFGPFMLMEKE
jgi:hypothetical protein